MMQMSINTYELLSTIIAVSCFIVAFVMASYFKLTRKIGSRVLKSFFVLYSIFLINLGVYFLDPNDMYLGVLSVLALMGAVHGMFMFKYVVRFFHKRGIKILSQDFLDIAVINTMMQSVKVNRKKGIYKPDAIPQFKSKNPEIIKGEILHGLEDNTTLYLDNEKKVKAKKLPIKFSGSFFKTDSEPGGVIEDHFHDIPEFLKVNTGIMTIIYLLDEEGKKTRIVQYKAGATLKIDAGTIHRVETEVGYSIEVYFPEITI